ncbi:MAG: hypothetical protein H8E44_02060 [Planctomycetes bacterium]|nr:hypothetical protein [Planctomycetota bacterium]
MIQSQSCETRPRARPWTPSQEQRETMRQVDATMKWLCGLTIEELARYAGQWVAAYDSEIVAVAPSRDELASKIAHFDRSAVVVHRVENRWMVR